MKRLLIAESSGILTDVIERAFQTRYEVHACCTGSDAIRLLNELRPDVLLISLSLPDTDGLAVLRKAKYIPPETFALTCYLDHRVCNAAAMCGIKHILMMPYAIQTIIGYLDNL